MEILCIIMLIWLFVIQVDINNIKDKLKSLSNRQLSDNTKEVKVSENTESEQPQETYSADIQTLIDRKENEISNNIQAIVDGKENETVAEQKTDESEKKSSFEEKFFGNIFNKIGAVAILIALCILVKIISPFIVFTNEMKIALGFLTGFGMLFAAFKVRKDEKMKKFSEVLMGTGFGALLITIYFGAGILKVFNTPTATTLAVLTTLAIYFVADKQKTVSTIVIGLIGGYLNPFFVNYHITMNFLFWYLIFLNVLSIVFVYRNRSKDAVNIINLVTSAICIASLSAVGNNEISIYQIFSLWGLYVIYDILCINKEEFTVSKPLRYVNFTVLTLLSLLIYKDYTALGIFLYGVSIFYAMLGIGYSYKTGEKENGYFHSCIISVFMTIFFFTQNDDLLRIAFWSFEALFVGFLAIKYKLNTLSKYMSVIYTAVICKLFISPDIYDTKYEIAVWNDRILYFLAPVVSGGIISYCAKHFDEIRKYEIFKFLSASLIYLYLILEINSVFVESAYYNTILAYIVPAIMFIYAINFNAMAKNAQNKILFIVAKNLVLWFGIFWLAIAELFSGFAKPLLPVANLRIVPYFILGGNIFYELRQKESEWKKYAAVILGFLYIHFESANILKYFTNIDWIISVAWVMYAGIISTVGIFRNKKVLKISGIWLSIITVCRLFLYDFATLDLIYKLIAFITLGAVLLIVSYIYNKRKEG